MSASAALGARLKDQRTEMGTSCVNCGGVACRAGAHNHHIHDGSCVGDKDELVDALRPGHA